MRTHLVKWGNSVAVRLPKAMLEEAQLAAGDCVELEKTETGSILVRSAQPYPSIEELISRITPENRHPETDWGPPVGKEVW